MSYGTIQIEKMTTESGYSLGAGNASSFKNRIINGGQVIDQRNAGAAVTPGAGATYFTDRFGAEITTASALTFQQVSDAPAGFVNSLKITVASSTAVSASTNNNLWQSIEGYNIADLGWGTASAKSVTISFWAKSSITGTYSLHMRNAGDAYFYIATYTIDAANTWEYKTITIAGPTVGTWNTTNGRGVLIGFVNLGNGSTFEGAAGSWQAGVKCATSGSVDFCSQANGSTFFITGVQFEVGTVATSFDFRSIGTELQLCQRYLPILGGANSGSYYCMGYAQSSTQANLLYTFKVTPRVPPTGVTIVSPTSLGATTQASGGNGSSGGFTNASLEACNFFLNVPAASYTVGNPLFMYSNGTAGQVQFTGCEL